jgi:hypothetical protein
MNKKNGMTMVMAMLFLLFIIPMALVTARLVNQTMRGSVSDVKNRSVFEMGTSAISDYMRQLTNFKNQGELTGAMLNRPADFALGKGLMNYNPTLSTDKNTIFLDAAGKYNLDPASPDRVDHMSALIRFDSPWGNIFPAGLSFYAGEGTTSLLLPNGTFTGGVYVDGKMTVNSTGGVFSGGPVVVTGELRCNHNVTIAGDLYLGGTKTGPGTLTVTGTTFGYAPKVTVPIPDYAYLKSIADPSRVFTSFRWIRFFADATYKTCSENESPAGLNKCTTQNKWSSSVAMPASGEVVFYADNCNIGVSGTIARRVTVVADGAYGDNHKGNVTTDRDIVYNAGNFCTAANCFQIIVRNDVFSLNLDDGDLNIHGFIYSDQGPSPRRWHVNKGGTNNDFYLYGFDKAGSNFEGNGRNDYHIADPTLSDNLSAGFSRKPVLVNWNTR